MEHLTSKDQYKLESRVYTIACVSLGLGVINIGIIFFISFLLTKGFICKLY